MILIGLIAGVASWTVIEILLYYGESISRHILWNGLAGATTGLFFGFFFGSAEGIMFSDSARILHGGVVGSIIGSLGGAGAMILSQWILYVIGNTEIFPLAVKNTYLALLSRSLGWSILGLIIGSLDGLRNGSGRRAFIGILGGLIGGFTGGVMLELLTRMWTNGFLARGIGMVLLGIGIGLFFSIFEYSRSYGLIKILTGVYRGKDYILTMKNTRLGSSPRAHIPLRNYPGIKKDHAVFIANRNGVIIKKIEGSILVNEKEVNEKELKYEDVIQAGSTKLLYLPK